MKRFFILSVMATIFVATLTTSCSMQSMTFKDLEKKGYVIGQLTPAQQLEIAPLLSAFPTYNATAVGYLASTDAVSYLYEGTLADFQNYASLLTASGFKHAGNAYAKIDRAAGLTYKVSAKTIQATKKQSYLVITYTSDSL